MTEFALSRTSLQHLLAFQPPRSLFRDFAGSSLPNLSHGSALCAAEAQRRLKAGIEEAVAVAIEQHNAPRPVERSRDWARSRGLKSPGHLEASTNNDPVTLTECAVRPGRIELVLAGASTEDALTIWRSALRNLELQSAEKPRVDIERPGERRAGLVVLSFDMPLPEVTPAVVTLTDKSLSEFRTLWYGKRRIEDGVLIETNGQEYRLRATVEQLSQPSQLSTAGLFDFGLYLLETWYSQRDHWARREVRLPSGEIVPTPGLRVLILDPRTMEARQRPTNPKPAANWRANQWRRVQSATLAREILVEARPPAYRALLKGCRDGRRPQPSNQLDTDLAGGLGVLDLPLANAFFVVLDDSLARTLFPLYSASDGGVFWGSEALKQAKKDARGEPNSRASHRLEDLPKELTRFSYIRSDPDLMLVASAEGWSNEQKRLVIAVMSEVTPASPRKPRFSRKRPVEVRPALDGYSPYNGGAGIGYKLSTWIEKVHGPEFTALESSGNVCAFLSDLLHLHHQLGLEVEIDGDGRNTVALLSELKRITSKRHWPKNAILKIFLPDDLSERLGQLLKRRNIEPTKPLLQRRKPVLDQPSSKLRVARKQNGLTLETLGQALGVSKAAISQWETGKRNIPSERCKELDAIFSGLKDVNFEPSDHS